MHRVGSLLPKCFLSFVTTSKENVSFSVLHGRFITKLCLFQSQSEMPFQIELQYRLTDCISGKSTMFSSRHVATVDLMQHGWTSVRFYSRYVILGLYASYAVYPAQLVDLDVQQNASTPS